MISFRTFRAFITEHKISLSDSELLDTHMKYHAAGIPLPDRPDLYQKYTGGPVCYDKPEGGYVQHHIGDASISHYDTKGTLHRTDGPAYIKPDNGNLGSQMWSVHGQHIADHRKFTFGDGTVDHYITIRKHYPNGETSLHEMNHDEHSNGENLKTFNDHLDKHGITSPIKLNYHENI